jgi:hypothetical protein
MKYLMGWKKNICKDTINKDTTIGILYVATGRYTFFWNDFYKSAEKNLFLGYKKKYFVFTDQPDFFSVYDNSVIVIKTPHLPWPYPTLYRYRFFLNASDTIGTCNYLFFFNSNMIILQKVGSEILPKGNQKLVVLKHPGFYFSRRKKFPYERDIRSTAYIPIEEGKFYFAGGLNGGITDDFLSMARDINSNIEKDEKNGIIAVWHDESHLNKYVLNFNQKLILSPRYGYPEGWYLRCVGSAKILITDKAKKGGHSYFRT